MCRPRHRHRVLARALGYRREGAIEGRFASLTGDGPTLTLQPVKKEKTVKNRMHPDLLVSDLDAEVDRLEGQGATRDTPSACEEFGQRWFVMADPEGNEFCLAQDPNR